MKDALKNYGAELAEAIVERFQSPEVRQLLDDTKAAEDTAAGTFEVIITTENLDRYQEVIKLDGWELDHYLKNPVVLWGHDHQKPIGLATSVEIADGKMVAKGKFAPTAFAQEIRQLYDAGIIKATSVGFIEKEREGNLITKAELLEFSFVSVPANPYALSLAMEKELSIDGLVTKGFMHVEKDAEEAAEPEAARDAVAEDHPAEEAAPADAANDNESGEAERSFSTKQLDPVIANLRSVLVALEALSVKSGEPEGDEPAQGDAEETEEERKYREFTEMRKLLQDFSTLTSEVLAEAREAVEARRAA